MVERDISMPMSAVASDLAHPHGFRKSMRTWMAENGISQEVAELCIDHAVYGKKLSNKNSSKEQSFSTDDEYQKSDLLILRRKAMEAYDNAVVANLPENFKAAVKVPKNLKIINFIILILKIITYNLYLYYNINYCEFNLKI